MEETFKTEICNAFLSTKKDWVVIEICHKLVTKGPTKDESA